MNLFSELKRRNVFKVGAAYLVSAWLILQLVSILLPAFNAPDWVIQVFILILAVGFIVALFIAWAFELTPEGIRPTTEVNPDDSITGQTGQKLTRLTIVTLALALLLVVFDAYVLTGSRDTAELGEGLAAESPMSEAGTAVNPDAPEENAIPELSIAVLPFANLSSDPEQEYFSDGLTEELLNKLAQVNELQVAGRTSPFTSRAATKTSGTSARRLVWRISWKAVCARRATSYASRRN